MGAWCAGSQGGLLLALLTLLTGAARMSDTTASLRTSGGGGGDPLSEWLGRVQVHLPNQTLAGKPGSSGYNVNLDDLTCSAHPATLLRFAVRVATSPRCYSRPPSNPVLTRSPGARTSAQPTRVLVPSQQCLRKGMFRPH